MSASSLSFPFFVRTNLSYFLSFFDSNRLTEHIRLTHTESFAEWQKADAGCTSRAFKHPGDDVTRTWRLAINFDWLHIWFRAGLRWWRSPKRLDAARCSRRGTALFPTFFRISSFVFSRTKTFIQVWNYLRMSKWWHNFHFWVNYPFKGLWASVQYQEAESFCQIRSSVCLSNACMLKTSY